MSKRHYGDQRGVTLIELLIVLTIMGIIVAFAYPNYKHQVYKSRRADAQTMLLETLARQQRYHSENSSYTDALDKLGYTAPDYSFDSNGKLLSKEQYYTLDMAKCASPNDDLAFCVSLTATPLGDQATDTSCQALAINSLGQKTSSGGGADCW